MHDSSYDSEKNNRNYYSSEEQDHLDQQEDSEIHMSLCLEAFKTHEPARYSEMKEIFE